jgi:cellulose biosynthesis protein BcsQ
VNTPVITFFNNTGGVGKTSLVYHLAWMFRDQGWTVAAVDLDPQANLTGAMLDEDRLEELWLDDHRNRTIYSCVEPLFSGTGDIAAPQLEEVDERLHLLVGDLSLSGFEESLSEVWSQCLDRKARAFRVTSAFWRVMQKAATDQGADVVLVDLGPNLGALNRAALIAADFVVVPLAPDLFSLQGLKNLGPTLRRWRQEWAERVDRNPVADLELPAGRMEPAGYVLLQHAVRLDRPTRAYDRWIARVPEIYHDAVLDEPGRLDLTVHTDPHALALLKHYRSLMPMAQEARKPIFHLKPADGAIGAHTSAVQDAYRDFRALAQAIARRTGLSLPDVAGAQLLTRSASS